MSSEPLKPPPQPEKQRGSWLPIALALVLCSGVFVVISFLTLGVFTPVLVIAGVLLAITGLHYCVWGWWLGGILREAEDEESDEER